MSQLSWSCPILYFLSVAFNFRYSEWQVNICIRMTTPSQLETVRKNRDDLKAGLLYTKEALADAQRSTDIDFWCERLERLDRKNMFCESKKPLYCKAKCQVSTTTTLPVATTWLSWLSCLHPCPACHCLAMFRQTHVHDFVELSQQLILLSAKQCLLKCLGCLWMACGWQERLMPAICNPWFLGRIS